MMNNPDPQNTTCWKFVKDFIQGDSWEADYFYVGNTLLIVKINKSADCQTVIIVNLDSTKFSKQCKVDDKTS